MNAVKRLLRGAGLGRLSRSLGTEVGWAKLLATLAGHGELRDYVEPHRVLWRCARAQRVALERVLTAQLAAAATILAVFSDVRRFVDAKHAASYAGLVPAPYHSGDREAYGRITKRGSGELRAMLCEAAHHASRPTHPLHPYFALRCAKRGCKIATSAVRPPTGPDHGCDAARRTRCGAMRARSAAHPSTSTPSSRACCCRRRPRRRSRSGPSRRSPAINTPRSPRRSTPYRRSTSAATSAPGLWNQLVSLRFLQAHAHVAIVGRVRVGKTFLARALGWLACRHGHTILALTADKMFSSSTPLARSP